MSFSRRHFLKLCGASAVVPFHLGLVPPGMAQTAGVIDDTRRKRALAEVALQRCRRRGAAFADVRIVRSVGQTIVARDAAVVPVTEWHYGAWPARLGEKVDLGFNVRVLKGGAWGFAASPALEEDEFVTVADLACDLAEQSARTMVSPVQWAPEPVYEDTYRTPYEIHPFDVSHDEKVALLLEINARVRRNPRIDRVFSWLDFWDENKYYANTDGSSIQQRIVRSDGSFFARAAAAGERAQRRFFLNPLNIGYEYIRRSRMADEAERVAEEAVEKVRAPRISARDVKDIILDPHNLCLLQHETIAHPTELDRTLLTEINFAGSTLLAPSDLNRFKFGPKILNVVADRTEPTLRATCGYDDDGVRTQRWDIVREGVLVGFQTTRDFAGFIGEKRSRGCGASDAWDHVPIGRIPNVSIEPGGPGAPTPDELIADTRQGLLFSGFATRIIQDFQRRRHTYTANAVWEIRNGKRARMVRDAHYEGANPSEIWHRVDALTDAASWQPAALDSDGVAQPSQRNHNTHGAPWARFTRMKVGGPTI